MMGEVNKQKDGIMSKIELLLRSRKFWALIAGVAAIVTGYLAGGLKIDEAIQAFIAALAAYMIGTGLDSPI
jgi:hypothetical protein